MLGAYGDRLPLEVREEIAGQVADRVRIGLWFALVAVPLFGLGDVTADRDLRWVLAGWRGLEMAVLVGGLWLLRRPAGRRRAVWIGLGSLVAIFIVSAEIGVRTGDLAMPLLLMVISPLVSSTLVPWGMWTQSASVAIIAGVSIFDLSRMKGGLAMIADYSGGAIGVVWVVSVYVAYEIDRHRAAVAGENLDRRRAEAERSALLEVASHISGTLDLKEILDRVQRLTAVLLPCDRVVTIYWDRSRQGFVIVAQHGTPAALLSEAASLKFSPSEPIAQRLLNGETVVVNDPSAQRWLPPELLDHFDITAMIVAPLVVRGRLLGALSAVSTQPERRFSATQVQLLEGIARQVALAIGSADLYRIQQEEAEVSAALARVGREMISSLNTANLLDRLCDVTRDLLGADFSNILLPQPDDGTFAVVAGAGLSAEMREGYGAVRFPLTMIEKLLVRLDQDEVVPVMYADREGVLPDEVGDLALRFGVTRCLYLAVRRGGAVIGLQEVGFSGPAAPFSAVQLRLARGIAQIAPVAMENWRLIAELERANHLKSDFVATMSHELRTPLNVIIGYNSLLRDGEFGPLNPDQVDTTERIAKNAEELLNLVNATLDLSRLESGRVRLDIRSTNVSNLVAEIDAEIRELRERPGLNFSWQLGPSLPSLRTDPAKLKVILKNLIGNAIKFTGQGDVTIGIRDRDGGVEFAVADSGIGIAPEAREVIFEPFRQGDHSTSNRFGGTGLGLYIVRRLLEMLGGSIELESELGRGSTFRVWVPSGGAPEI